MASIKEIEKKLAKQFEKIDDVAFFNQKKVLDAFAECKITTQCFAGTTGYGYDDQGRDKLAMLFSHVFKTEKAIVSPLITCGSHAISIVLYGLLRPNDTILSISGELYDTLYDTLFGKENGSLENFGIKFKQIELKNNNFDKDLILKAIKKYKPKVVFVQRSRGYTSRKALSIKQMQEIKRINDELEETNEKLEQAYLECVQTLRYTVEAKDTYTRGHSDRVSEFSVLIGKKLGLPEEQLKILRIGGLFHDIGKIGIPDSILQKETKLTDDEYSEIKNHPSIGAHILGAASIFKDIIPIVKHHHERYDGKGYPSGLAGENIPYLARIAAVADTFDAMTSKRSYRDALDLQYVKDEFERCKGTQFDPQIAEVFINILNNDFEKIKEIQDKY